MALVGRSPIPGQRGRIVLRDTLAILVHDTKIELCRGVALVGQRRWAPHCGFHPEKRLAVFFALEHD